jgi:sugar phosphate isomerase/epimerase
VKLAYCTWGMPQLSVDEAVDCLARLGYDGIQLTLSDARPFTTELSRLSFTERKRIGKLLDDAGLELPSLSGHTNLMASQPEEQRKAISRLKAMIDACLDFARPEGVPSLNTIVGGREGEWEERKAELVDRLGELVAYAESCGVVIALEPHVQQMLDTPAKTLWLLSQIPSSSLRLCFDISHFEVLGIPMADSVRLLAPHAVFTHVKDQRGYSPRHQFLIPGEGDFDYVSYLREMHRVGYTGHIGVEISFMVQDRPDYDPRDAAERSYRVLSQAFATAGVPRR